MSLTSHMQRYPRSICAAAVASALLISPTTFAQDADADDKGVLKLPHEKPLSHCRKPLWPSPQLVRLN